MAKETYFGQIDVESGHAAGEEPRLTQRLLGQKDAERRQRREVLVVLVDEAQAALVGCRTPDCNDTVLRWVIFSNV